MVRRTRRVARGGCSPGRASLRRSGRVRDARHAPAGDRRELAVTFGIALGPDQRLAELEADQRQAPRDLQATVDASDGVRLIGGRLELSPPDALDENPAAVRLRAHLDRLMPHIDIPDLLAEVEGWTGFAGQLTHTAGATPRIGDLPQHLHAALLARGLNLGPVRMTECCPLSYRQLAWATEWYLGDDQLQAANDALVNYLHQLQLASHWCTGTFSSSDGQRSIARGRATSADAMAREFGFRRGALNLVNWVSDQYSQYGTKVVSVAEREAMRNYHFGTAVTKVPRREGQPLLCLRVDLDLDVVERFLHRG